MNQIFSGEYFEIAFFAQKSPFVVDRLCKFLKLQIGENIEIQSDIAFLRDKNILLTIFDESDFFEIELSLPRFVIEEETFMENIIGISDMANKVCKNFKEISFITFVYELTGYIDRVAQSLCDYNAELLSKFPIVFYPTDKKIFLSPSFTFDVVSCKINGISCSFKYNGKTQDIFSY